MVVTNRNPNLCQKYDVVKFSDNADVPNSSSYFLRSLDVTREAARCPVSLKFCRHSKSFKVIENDTIR